MTFRKTGSIGTCRSERGSILVLVVLIAFVFAVPFLVGFGRVGSFVIQSKRIQDIVDAAGLLAANDVSRIVIDDPNFGYVSLSNYPPIGKATRAPDGEPLPVTGINTLIGTLRQNSLIAHTLANPTMISLANADHTALQNTISELNSTLSDSLNSTNLGECADVQGEMIDPLGNVTNFLSRQLPPDVELESVQLSNGWLTSGGTTTVPIPQPERLAQVPFGCSTGDNYRPFVDLPVAHKDFNFAGVGPVASFVNASDFQGSDGEHVSSIVRIECTVALKNPPFSPFGSDACNKMTFVAACQPYSLPDTSTRGTMMVRFSGPPVAGLQSWRDFLGGTFHDNQVMTYNVVGGDYPVDPDARMEQTQSGMTEGTSQQFGEHLYYWLRNGHLRPRIDSVLRMVNDPFPASPSCIYAYEFCNNGMISRKLVARDCAPVAVTADAQVSSVADTTIQNGISPVIVFRDNVKKLGTKSGGKHAGQPLAGTPMSWSQLKAFGGDTELSMGLARRSSYPSGLALDIEIGGTRESTAIRDADMSRLRATRRI